MLQKIRNTFMAFVAAHRTAVRFFFFLLALALVVGAASGIEDFISAFLGGAPSAAVP